MSIKELFFEALQASEEKARQDVQERLAEDGEIAGRRALRPQDLLTSQVPKEKEKEVLANMEKGGAYYPSRYFQIRFPLGEWCYLTHPQLCLALSEWDCIAQTVTDRYYRFLPFPVQDRMIYLEFQYEGGYPDYEQLRTVEMELQKRLQKNMSADHFAFLEKLYMEASSLAEKGLGVIISNISAEIFLIQDDGSLLYVDREGKAGDTPCKIHRS